MIALGCSGPSSVHGTPHEAVRFPTAARGESCGASPLHRPREDGLTYPADTSRTNLAAALGVLPRWRLQTLTCVWRQRQLGWSLVGRVV
jgi:hypothetical protein